MSSQIARLNSRANGERGHACQPFGKGTLPQASGRLGQKGCAGVRTGPAAGKRKHGSKQRQARRQQLKSGGGKL